MIACAAARGAARPFAGAEQNDAQQDRGPQAQHRGEDAALRGVGDKEDAAKRERAAAKPSKAVLRKPTLDVAVTRRRARRCLHAGRRRRDGWRDWLDDACWRRRANGFGERRRWWRW